MQVLLKVGCEDFKVSFSSFHWSFFCLVPVLASGTHPDMMTSGNGGFLLSATLVTNEGCDELRMKSMKEIKQAKRLKVNQRT